MTALSSVAVAQQFRDVSTKVGLVSEAKKSWGNPIWGDINSDGFLDLIVPTHGLFVSGGPFVYVNNAGGSFTDIRATSGIKRNNPDSSDWHGFSFGDYDGDGNLDLYISEGAKKGTKVKSDELFRGVGDGTFEYASRLAGIETSTNRGRCGFWVDYDNDGQLDLFVKNYGSVNRLYKNNGDGTFTQIANAAGLASATLGTNVGSICSFADYDNDGFMDVLFSGDHTTDALYKNQGDGTFVDVTATAGLKPLTNGHGIAWGDYNNDGLLDLYVARGHQGTKGITADTLYRNNGNGTFTDVTAAAGLTTTANTWAAVWGDYDNDGFLDLFVTNGGTNATGVDNANLLYHNNGDGTFTNVADAEGVALQDNTSAHKGAAWGDYNNDGFLDLIIKDGIGNEKDSGSTAIGLHRLFKNMGNSNHFIKVNLVGRQSNSRGIGARFTVSSTARESFRQNNGGGGGEYASQGSEPLHFGIGTATAARVTVIWPSGVVDILPSVAADSAITVVEGSHP
jgi:enediyne biosynthesis protein E4